MSAQQNYEEIRKQKYREIIKNEMKKLRKPVKLKVFTSIRAQPDGTRRRECAGCDYTMSLLKIYEENSEGKLTIEELSIHDDEEFAKKYDIQRVPTILFIDESGREIIRYLANPQGGEIQPFVESIFVFAGAPNYYENTITQNLERIKPSTIKVMITNQCPYCPQMVRTSNLFALASKGKIRSVIVDIVENQDIGQYYDAAGVPFTIVNDQKAISGMVPPHEILHSLIGGNINIQY